MVCSLAATLGLDHEQKSKAHKSPIAMLHEKGRLHPSKVMPTINV
jgi:hypothetical protein